MFILMSTFVTAIGVSPPKQYVDFDSEGSVTVPFVILNYGAGDTYIQMSASGSPLAEYVSFSQDYFEMKGDEYQIEVTVDFPAYEELTKFGKDIIRIEATETTAKNAVGAFAVVTAIEPWLIVQIPVPGNFAEISSFEIGNVLGGEDTLAEFTLDNQGTKSLSGTRAEIIIEDNSGARVDKISFSNIALGVDKEKSFSEKISSSTYNPGKYTATLTYYFDDELQPATVSTTFFVGTTDVEVVGYTSDLQEGQINKVRVTLQSLWGDELTSIRAAIVDFENHTQAMPVIDLAPFEERVVETYIDVPFLNASPFFINTSVQKNLSVDTVMTLQFPVEASTDVDKELALSFTIHAIPDLVEEEKSSSLEISTTTLLIAAVVLLLLILIVVVVLVLLPKKNGSKKTKK